LDDWNTFPPVETLAEQIALLEFDHFSKVRVSDLLHVDTSPRITRPGNTATRWDSKLQLLTRWVATRIIRAPTKQQRGKLIGKFVSLIDVRTI
jgi:hypothetical protein